MWIRGLAIRHVTEIRNPKSEIRDPKEARNPKSEWASRISRSMAESGATVGRPERPDSFCFWGYEWNRIGVASFWPRISGFGLPSDLGFRISDFPPQEGRCARKAGPCAPGAIWPGAA